MKEIYLVTPPLYINLIIWQITLEYHTQFQPEQVDEQRGNQNSY